MRDILVFDLLLLILSAREGAAADPGGFAADRVLGDSVDRRADLLRVPLSFCAAPCASAVGGRAFERGEAIKRRSRREGLPKKEGSAKYALPSFCAIRKRIYKGFW